MSPAKKVGETCSVCGDDDVFASCSGCGDPLCARCAAFELAGSGCGSVWPLYYCPVCVMDPKSNPNAVFKETVP